MYTDFERTPLLYFFLFGWHMNSSPSALGRHEWWLDISTSVTGTTTHDQQEQATQMVFAGDRCMYFLNYGAVAASTVLFLAFALYTKT